MFAFGHLGLELKMLCHCTLCSMIVHKAQALAEDAHMWQCTPDT